MRPLSREDARELADAHGEGLHAEAPRDGCPECDRRELSSYPPLVELLTRIRRGARVRGHDPDYELDLEGVVDDVRLDRFQRAEVFFRNELPGQFEGARVALPADLLEEVER